ncbi:MAG TPA: CCC motif membrane protein [Flavobacterium sp.]|uniref:CCC motif membrane protein n=1 Tax=unclassified Flavobacterium TaxID=196869 RepID=UPI0025C2AB58|nr:MULTISPECIES: CCC motif membrane protein [unclassified Flavobacterium]HRE76862.1 CCC motif membrane protein [Flavobacterium sp.]
MEKQKLPNATAVIILGILSIVTCCCYGVLGIILGIIALVLAKKDTQLYLENPELYSNYSNIKTGKILAYIGLALSFIYLLLMIWMIATFGFEGMQDQELMQEKMRELFGV